MPSKNLAIIPARGGSKGIVNKNTKVIAGKPLIAWTIEQALNTKDIDRVIVTTDCKEIASVSREFGAEVPFLRPPELATDNAATEPVLAHAISWLSAEESYAPDNIVLLQPTSPVRYKNRITQALKKIEDHGGDSLLSVVESEIFLWSNLDKPRAMYDYLNRPRRQDIDANDRVYRENGSIYITKTQAFNKFKNRLSENNVGFLMSPEEGVDIDTQLDWDIAERILFKLVEENKI